MTIGVLHLDFVIYGVRSLKEKRRIVKSIIAKIRNRFNCSVAETDYQDLWQRTKITVCVVSNEQRFANIQLSEIAKFAATHTEAEILDYRIEML